MSYFPLFIELRDSSCLVVGGGRVALGKVRQLRSFGARITVAAPALTSGLARLARERKIRWVRRAFRPGDLAGRQLVVAATDEQAVNERVSRLARRKGIPVNVVDQPALCSFIFPSVVKRGKLVLAVSTGGASPALAKWIRRDLERRYGPEMGRSLEGMARVRGQVKRKAATPARRKALYEKALKAYLRVLGMSPSTRRSSFDKLRTNVA
ncbi:MAG: bifunctional precorrin-2 dehydrogenase/sirohydrochlorin ferrochelatase [Candidatus Omnitrophica bacterium]|nr:bifunctional precorrin-2 dehydrogenase/sirohydrochlorin ferrochelatase [Candidatus Omnitrophota bacterium]